MPRVTRLAFLELTLSAAILALGLPMAADAFHRVMTDDRLILANERRIAAGTTDRVLKQRAWSDAERKDIAFALLAGADSPTITASERSALIARAVSEFRAYVARVPADGAAWAGLASAELAQGDTRPAVEALKASILATPWSASLVLWRCGLGIDLFRSLDDEGRELMKGQFRLQAQRSAAVLVETAIPRGAVRIARILLASSPDELMKFEAELAKHR